MTASRIFLYFCLTFVFGIFINSIVSPSQLLMLGLLIFGIILISVFWRYKKVATTGFCLLFLVLGIWRHQAVLSAIPEIEEKDVSFTAEVVKEPAVGENSAKLTVVEVKMKEAEPLSLEGKVLVTTWRYPEYQYGDKLKITGKLEKPAVFEGFNYRNYLKKDGIFGVMYQPEIERVGSGFGNPVMSFLFSFKNGFKEATSRFISPPQQGILEALFFGDEGKISREWKDKLNLTGTRHITAVSGMNITIISVMLLNFLLALGFWRKQAFCFAVILLFLYVLTIGFPPSAVRAGIMAGILMLAQYLGRMSQATRAVVFAGTLMLFFNPLLLKLDVGFQLSFLAVLGMVHLQPTVTRLLARLPDPKVFPLRGTLATTLAAQVFTLPILIYNFGYIPLLSPLANILIVPVLAPATILIFVFGFTSMVFWPLGYILSWPTWLSLTYIVSLIDLFAKIPFARLSLAGLHWFWLVVVYLALGFVIWRLNEKRKIW